MYKFFGSSAALEIYVNVQKIVKRLRANDPSLKIVDFRAENLDSEASREIFLALQYSTHVKELQFFGNCSTGAINDLAASIKNHKSLEKIDLVMNQLNDEDIHVLCESLQVNTSVKLLDVRQNEAITDIGAHHIAELLKNSRYIKTIDIANTGIYYNGLKEICVALESNPLSSLVQITQCSLSVKMIATTMPDELKKRFDEVFDEHQQALTAKI